MYRFKLLIVLFFMLLVSTAASAQIPRTLSYQGILTDNAGKPRLDQDYQFTFCLYDTAIGSTPLWSEQKTLSVRYGLFSTILGDQKPFGATVKFDKQYWLGIQIGNETELTPRIRLTSVGYSLNALKADTAKVAMTSIAGTTWMTSDSNIYRRTGNVGIGMIPSNNEAKLRVHAENLFGSPWKGHLLELSTTGAQGSLGFGKLNSDGVSYIQSCQTGAANPIVFNPGGGNVGIGTIGPTQKLEVNGAGLFDWDGSYGTVFLGDKYHGINSKFGYGVTIFTYGVTNGIFLQQLTGNVGIGQTNPTSKLDIAGRTKTQVLEITGGSDLAEPFELSHTDSLPVGSLVVIDPENPGKLKQATESYDKRVAGVISGAGGINPGLTLTQQGKLEGSQHVALTGKVYALATTANGIIEPGDLLTTSDIPGHAMKATDHEHAFGSVIGKAMSGLKEGKGLVLVLIQPH